MSYSYRFSGSEQPEGTKLLNGDDYTMLMKQAYFNRNQEDCNIPEYSYDKAQFVDAYGTAQDFENFNNNTDWVDEVSKYGFTHDHNLSVSGGGERRSSGLLSDTISRRVPSSGRSCTVFSQPDELGVCRVFPFEVLYGICHHLYG